MSGLAINSVLVVDNVDKVCSEILKKSGIAVTEIEKKLTKEELLNELKVSSVPRDSSTLVATLLGLIFT